MDAQGEEGWAHVRSYTADCTGEVWLMPRSMKRGEVEGVEVESVEGFWCGFVLCQGHMARHLLLY